jgi:hypothetical protein
MRMVIVRQEATAAIESSSDTGRTRRGNPKTARTPHDTAVTRESSVVRRHILNDRAAGEDARTGDAVTAWA